MVRNLLVTVWLACYCGIAAAQDHHHHGPSDPTNPLGCDTSVGEACFHAVLDDFNVVNSPHPQASGTIHLALNSACTELRYHVQLDELRLKALASDRTALDDVIGVHLHFYVPDTVGPHVLNIFGLATYNIPAEEDADLFVDYVNQTLTGIYDDSDATIDPSTGQPYLPFYPLTSKPLSDWIDNLENGDLMLAVHTNASGFPTMAIHGHIGQVAPEPHSAVFLVTFWIIVLAGHRTRLARQL